MTATAQRVEWTYTANLNERDFARLAEFIEQSCGIKMPPAKRCLVEGRLRKRLRDLGMDSFSDYCHYLFEQGGLIEEGVYLIDAITTNKTDFFREPKHFAHLIETVLPAFHPHRLEHPFRVWCAASSIGAEAYTVAIILDDYARSSRSFTFEIVGTDICTEVLEQSRDAIYPPTMIEMVPHKWRHRYFLRSIDTQKPTIRVCPEIRNAVQFGYLNLMDDRYPIEAEYFDVVFCRNILIYFDRPTQEIVLKKICRHLRPGGFLYIGHGESATGMSLPLTSVAPSVFRKG